METNITPFDLQRMFLGETPTLYLLEIAVRVVIVYLYALLLIRFMGKRGQAELSPLELVIIISLGSAAGDPMFYPAIPLVYAFVVITVMVVIDVVMTKLQEEYSLLQKFIEGDPQILIVNGTIKTNALQKEKYTKEELFAKLREKSVRFFEEVELAILEPSGKLSVYTRNTYRTKRDLTKLPNVK